MKRRHRDVDPSAVPDKDTGVIPRSFTRARLAMAHRDSGSWSRPEIVALQKSIGNSNTCQLLAKRPPLQHTSADSALQRVIVDINPPRVVETAKILKNREEVLAQVGIREDEMNSEQKKRFEQLVQLANEANEAEPYFRLVQFYVLHGPVVETVHEDLLGPGERIPTPMSPVLVPEESGFVSKEQAPPLDLMSQFNKLGSEVTQWGRKFRAQQGDKTRNVFRYSLLLEFGIDKVQSPPSVARSSGHPYMRPTEQIVRRTFNDSFYSKYYCSGGHQLPGTELAVLPVDQRPDATKEIAAYLSTYIALPPEMTGLPQYEVTLVRRIGERPDLRASLTGTATDTSRDVPWAQTYLHSEAAAAHDEPEMSRVCRESLDGVLRKASGSPAVVLSSIVLGYSYPNDICVYGCDLHLGHLLSRIAYTLSGLIKQYPATQLRFGNKHKSESHVGSAKRFVRKYPEHPRPNPGPRCYANKVIVWLPRDLT